MRGSNIAPSSRRIATHCRRTRTASCSEHRRQASDRARYTSRASDCRAMSGSRRTRDAGRRCGWARDRGSASTRCHARPQAAYRNPPSCRTAARCRYSPRCRSRNRPSARGRSATARSHRRRAISHKAAAAKCRRDRRRRHHLSPETSADRSDRRCRRATSSRRVEPCRKTHPRNCPSRGRTRKQRPGSNQQAKWDGRVTAGTAVPAPRHEFFAWP